MDATFAEGLPVCFIRLSQLIPVAGDVAIVGAGSGLEAASSTDGAVPSAGVAAAMLAMSDTVERASALKARKIELGKQQAALQKEIKNGRKRRSRLANRLRGFADADVLGMIGLRALAQANATAAPKARAKAKSKS